MPIPDLTPLQFFVLSAVGSTERSGREVRARLEEEGHKKSAPAFYQLMSRMEDSGLVKGENYRVEVQGQQVTERRYKVTGTGIKAANAARQFIGKHGAWLPGKAVPG